MYGMMKRSANIKNAAQTYLHGVIVLRDPISLHENHLLHDTELH